MYDPSSVFQNPMEVINGFKSCNDQLQNMNYSLNATNQQLSAANNNLQSNLKASYQAYNNLFVENQSLHALIARLKTEKMENPRTFDDSSREIVYSIEPSGKRKPIGFFLYQGAELITIGDKQYLRINYNGAKCADAAFIPVDEIAKGNLTKYFRSFKRCGSKELANAFIYWIVTNALCSPDLAETVYPKYPGIYHWSEDGKRIKADFVYYTNNADDVLLSYLPENYTRKGLPCSKIPFSDIIKSVQPYLTENAAYILLAYGIAGLFSSFLHSIHFTLPVLLNVSAPNAEAEALATCLLRTYEKEKQPYSMTMSKTELTHILKEANCETIVLNDDTTAESNTKKTSAIDTILRFPADPEYNPHNIVILSKSIRYFIPGEKILPIDLSEQFGKGISNTERSQLVESLYSMLAYMGKEYCEYVNKYFWKLKMKLEELRAEEHGFETENEKITFAVLYGMLQFWAKIFRTDLPVDLKDYIVKCITDAQGAETGRDLAIVNEFYQMLSTGIKIGVLTVSELNRDMGFHAGQNILIHDKDLLLAEESTIKNVFLPNIPTAATVNMILTALDQEGYLISTNGHRKPTTVYDENGDPKMMKLIAFRYRDMVHSETAMYIDNLKQQAYFAVKVPDKNFIPLIQDHLGKTAGQHLENGSNQHRFVTGKSGSGKTVFLILLAYWLAIAKNQIVILDSNSSFTKNAVSEVLPKSFIDDHITFCCVNDGIPVNLLHTYPEDSKPARRNALCNILGAGIRDMSQSQEIAIKTTVDKMLKTTQMPTHNDLRAQLEKADGASETSIRHKLFPVFDELIENEKETPVDWFTFIHRSKEIIIVSMDEELSENGSQLTDMLLASLYEAQIHEVDQKQLSIIIDEIHNQNLGDKGIIGRILKQGRKQHIDLSFATQYVNDVRQNQMMKQANLSVYFKPALASRASAAAMLGMKKCEEYKLDKLKTGECFVQGSIYNFELKCSEEAVIHGSTHLLNENRSENKNASMC